MRISWAIAPAPARSAGPPPVHRCMRGHGPDPSVERLLGDVQSRVTVPFEEAIVGYRSDTERATVYWWHFVPAAGWLPYPGRGAHIEVVFLYERRLGVPIRRRGAFSFVSKSFGAWQRQASIMSGLSSRAVTAGRRTRTAGNPV